MTIERNEKGQFPKGTSGNAKGRGKGVRGKAMTTHQVSEWLGKRLESYLLKVQELGESTFHPHIIVENDETGELEVKPNLSYDPKMSFTCYKELITAANQARQEEAKDKQNKKKAGGGNTPKEDKKDDHSTPVISMFK